MIYENYNKWSLKQIAANGDTDERLPSQLSALFARGNKVLCILNHRRPNLFQGQLRVRGVKRRMSTEWRGRVHPRQDFISHGYWVTRS